jgi:hypothetical protein
MKYSTTQESAPTAATCCQSASGRSPGWKVNSEKNQQDERITHARLMRLVSFGSSYLGNGAGHTRCDAKCCMGKSLVKPCCAGTILVQLASK